MMSRTRAAVHKAPERFKRLGTGLRTVLTLTAVVFVMALSAGLSGTPAHAQRCNPGYGLCSTGGCAPLGSICCRGGGYCRSGQICIKNGTACLNRGSDRVCGNGAYCNAGSHCGRNGRCYPNAPAVAPLATLRPLDNPPAVAPPVVAPPPPPPAAQPTTQPRVIAGLYTVVGTTTNGQRYTGQVSVRGSGDNVKVEWRLTNGSSYSGQGSMKGDIVTINWGDLHPIIYRLEPETGILRGTWANGRASDVLTPFRP